MRFTIIGCGAVGGTVGAHMIRAGHDVLLCDTDPAHVAAMNADGLRITGPLENFTVRTRAVTPSGLPDQLDDVVLVSVRSYQTRVAAGLLRDRLSRDATVVSLQDGLTFDLLGEALGLSNLLVGLVNFGANFVSPGIIMQDSIGTLRIGELHGRSTERLRRIAAALPYARESDSILAHLWAKEAHDALLFTGAVSDLSIAELLERQEYRPLMLGVAREVLAQAPTEPVSYDGFDPDDLETSVADMARFHRARCETHSETYRELAIRHGRTEVAERMGVLRGPLTHEVGALIRAIERGERVCEVANLDLLAAYERLYRIGVPLHAVVSALPAPQRASQGPLHGTAVAVKDIIDVSGSPRGNGNPADMAGQAASIDAPVVDSLRRAGADIFALASLLEYAAGAPHPDLPEARNPAHPDHTAGGSSGGSAALVAAGVCPAALGTDTGGSIRIPAAYCGIVGFKPSFGLLETTGITPLSPTLDHVGVLTDSVPTAIRMMAALTDTSGDFGGVEPTNYRLGVLEGQLVDSRLDPELAAMSRSALRRLEISGVQLTERDSTILDDASGCLEDILLVEAWQFHGDTVVKSPGHYGAPTLRLLRAAASVAPERREHALQRRSALLPRAASLLHGVDALIGPVVPYVAPVHTPPIDTPEGEIEGIFTSPYNVTGQPAVVLPCGVTSAGLPVGLQLAGAIGEDAALLRLAAAVEATLASGAPN